jgi:hypothetical protein
MILARITDDLGVRYRSLFSPKPLEAPGLGDSWKKYYQG